MCTGESMLWLGETAVFDKQDFNDSEMEYIINIITDANLKKIFTK
jgi:hypothetical protein